jgi:uncharacterized membrane protein (DUF2068 family)
MSMDVETFVCAFRGHATPAAKVARLGPEDAGFGIDVHPSWRISRCLRCDAWIGAAPPAQPARERITPLDEAEVPRRGKPLRQAVIVRLIAIERAVHAVVFTIIAVLAILVRTHLAGVQSWVRTYLQSLARTESQTGQANGNSIVAREGTKLLHLRSGTLNILIITAAVYAVVEATEAVGLWYERRWAEYLTALATAGFVPFEIDELLKKVTVVRAGALVINLAVIVYLVYAKQLFGLGRRRAADNAAAESDLAPFSPPF